MAFDPPAGNITSNVEMFSWINSVVNNMFFPGVLFAIFIIIIVKLSYNSNDIGRSFATASFICMILSVLLRTADLVNNTLMVIFIILTAVGAVWMHVENSKFG